MDKELFLKALREAFDAGERQGSEKAIAWEHGSRNWTKDDEAFTDCLAEWNGDDSPIQQALKHF